MEGKRHYYWIDFIRFLAAFVVLCSHYRGAFFVEYGLLAPEQQNPLVFLFYLLTRLGHESVLIFFVMSGFLVGGKAIERILNGTVDVKQYALDRTVRIMLPLIGCLLLGLVVHLLIGQTISWKNWLGSLFSLQGIFTGTPNNEPLWSLSYEVWFYILMGALSILLTKGNKIIALFVLVIALAVFTKLSAVYLFIWIIGAFAYLIVPKRANRWFITLGIVVFVGSVLALQYTSGSRAIGENSLLFSRQVWEIISATAFAGILMNVISIEPRKWWTIGLNKIGTRLAQFSYTLYLVHVPILRLMEYVGLPKSEMIDAHSVLLFVMEIAIATFLSWIMYLLFEKHTGKIKGIILSNIKYLKR